MATKSLTNEQVIKKLLKDLSTIEVAVLRERIMTICAHTLKNEAEGRESMKNSFIHPDLYFNTIKKISSIVNS